MTAPSLLLGLALAAAIGCAALIAGAIYLLRPEQVFLRDQTILKKHKGRREQMSIVDISEIRYHYHAVVGFVAVWEFVARGGKSLSVDGKAKGIDDVLRGLEKSLPGFSLVDFKRKFDEGDVEDTIDVWRSA